MRRSTKTNERLIFARERYLRALRDAVVTGRTLLEKIDGEVWFGPPSNEQIFEQNADDTNWTR